MKIIVDTREQDSLDFPFKEVDEVIVQKLDVGDYASMFQDGTISPIVFERKSKGDLWGTLTGQTKVRDENGRIIKKVSNHKRFRKEIQRAIDNNTRLVLIVECSLLDIMSGYSYKVRGGRKQTSKVRGSSILKTMFTLWVKYGVFPVFCANREEMANYIYGTFLALEKQYNKEK